MDRWDPKYPCAKSLKMKVQFTVILGMRPLILIAVTRYLLYSLGSLARLERRTVDFSHAPKGRIQRGMCRKVDNITDKLIN